MRTKIAAVFALLVAGGMLSGCVVEPGWGWGGGWRHHHHEHFERD